MRRWLAWCGVVIGVAVIGYAILARKSDEEQIQEQLERLAGAVRVETEENPIFRLKRLEGEFAELFVENVTVRVPELSSVRQGRRELVAMAARAGAYFSSVDVSFDNTEIVVGNLGANVTTTATLTATRRGQDVEHDKRRVTLRFTKPGGDWLIDSISVATKLDERP